MAHIVDSMAPADTRDQCYRLLSERAPAKVVIDTDLPSGTWYVVRGAEPWERRAAANQAPEPTKEL